MDHSQFKSNQTAAAYVANDIDAQTQEAFELHMMGCTECTEDVEIWRAIRNHMPREQGAQAAPFRRHWWGGWGMAASFAAALVLSGAGGWYLRSLQSPSFDRSVFVNLPAVTRGFEECTPVRLDQGTRVVVVRVPGVPAGQSVTVADFEGRELDARRGNARLQGDGSWVVRVNAAVLERGAVRLQAGGEPLGCLAGTD